MHAVVLAALVLASGPDVDGGVLPSSAWLQGPSARRQPRPSDPPTGPERRFLEAAETDAGVPAPRPFHPYFEGLVEEWSADAGNAWVDVGMPGVPDGGPLSVLPRVRMALPRGSAAPDMAPTEVMGAPLPRGHEGRSVHRLVRAYQVAAGMPTVPEALAQVPGVFVLRHVFTGGSPLIRGMGGSRVMVRVDGVRLNTTLTGDDRNLFLATVDPWQVETMDVLAGSASVVHGGDAMGGVVDVRSLGVDHGSPLTVRADGAVHAQSADTGRGVRLGLGGGMGPVSVFLGGSLRDAADVRSGRGWGVQPETRAQDGAVQARAAVRVFGQELQFGYDGARRSDFPITSMCLGRNGRNTGDCHSVEELGRDTAWGRLVLRPAEWLGEGDVTLAWNHPWQNTTRWDGFRGRQDRTRDGVHAFGTTLRAATARWWVGPLGVRASGGAEGWHNVVESRFFRAYGGRSYADLPGLGEEMPTLSWYAHGATETRGGAWVQLEWNALEWVELRTGFRAEVSRVVIPDSSRDPGGFSRFYGSPSAFTQLVVLLGGHGSVGAGVHHGFHLPNVADLSGRTYTSLGYEYTDAAEQRAEHALSAEGHARLVVGRVTARADIHATRWNGAPQRERGQFRGDASFGGEPVYRRGPGEDAWLAGAEALLDVRILEDIHAFATWTYLISERLRTREPLSGSPPPHGAAGIRYAPTTGFHGTVGARAMLPAKRYARSDKADPLFDPAGTSQSAVFFAGGGWQFTRRSGVDLFVENVLDEPYRSHGTLNAMPGINARLQLRLGL